MSNLASSSIPLLEYLGISLIQKAADQALGQGILKISSDASGLALDLGVSSSVSIDLANIEIGDKGLTGRMFIEGISAATPLEATLFDGFTIGLTSFDVSLSNNAISSCHVAGQLHIPFFTDGDGNPKTVDVELSIRADGSLALSLAVEDSTNPTTSDGLVKLIYSIGGGAVTIEIQVASLEADLLPDGTTRIVISGNLQITTLDLQWPTFELRGLGIDSKGNVSLDGGWIDLPNQTALDFYGFHVALQKLGFGSDGGGRWIGFNGDIHLVEGLSLGGSVRGLRINLETGALSFDGVSIDFEIPGVLTIKGAIDHIHVDAYSGDDLTKAGLLSSLFDQIQNGPGVPALPKKVDVFAGDVDVLVQAAGDLEIDGRFIVGHFGGTSVFFLALDAELPVGIPIFLDISLYGLQGLVASNLEPAPEPEHTWWEWYKYPTDAAGIDTAAPPDFDATSVAKWMRPKDGALAIGAGAVIGTSVDDGFTVSAGIAFVLILPGPVITLIGKANILSKRIGGANQDAMFNAMAVYDGNSETFDLTVEAHYEIPIVLEIDGSAELYVSATGPEPRWYFALGRPPHEKRLKARIFDLFESDAYFVVSDQGLVTGTWTGYRGSWSFGPLSVSLEAYLATLAAIQWSPLQIGGGLELHGDVHLEAFGIGLGISADALLEGCAPNPFWVHGEFSVELDLPWPLPDVGATISLSWGGDDGSVPPAPLALSHVDANLADHTNSAGQATGDHYLLLAHRPGFPQQDPNLQYDDPAAPGMLALGDPSLTAWNTLVQGKTDLLQILPTLAPDGATDNRYAPVVPQDAHFVLSFAHPNFDKTAPPGFLNSKSDLPPEPTTSIRPPSLVGADDMSNLSLDLPTVQWQYRHSLLQVAIFQYVSGSWEPTCAMPEMSPPGPTKLNGVWMTPTSQQGGIDPYQLQTQLKIFPYRLLPGKTESATWGPSSAGQTFSTSFTDQGLQFVLDPSVSVTINSPAPYSGGLPGLAATNATSTAAKLRIQFSGPVELNSIVAVAWDRDGEIVWYRQPDWSGDNGALSVLSATQDPATLQWTQVFPTNTRIQELEIMVGQGRLLLYEISYRLPDIEMAILPEAPAIYAIQVVTQIESRRVSNDEAFQPVSNGFPIVETAYVQTVCGPATAVIDKAMTNLPSPFMSSPVPALAQNCLTFKLQPSNIPTGQQPQSAFPLSGKLMNLGSYRQWSWPPDGAMAAYYAYDVNVEFTETYVNALYTAFADSGDDVANALHFRCVDRNQRHTLLRPVDIHVPSAPAQSALVAEPIGIPPLPAALSSPLQSPRLNLTKAVTQSLALRANLVVNQPTATILPGETFGDPVQLQRLTTRTAVATASKVDPGVAAAIIELNQQQQDAAAAIAIWFRPLSPRTRYTVDVVAGPFAASNRSFKSVASSTNGLLQVFGAPDASGVLKALQAYYAKEDALTSLLRFQFTTSAYSTFQDQMANVHDQIAGKPGVSPIRVYSAAVDPLTWLAGPSNPDKPRTDAQKTYTDSQKSLAALIPQFKPLADALTPDGAPGASGWKTLVQARGEVEENWIAFSAATSAVFDSLIAALGRSDLVSAALPKPVPPPGTELSLLISSTGEETFALLFESDESLPWRRIWQWVSLTPQTPPVNNFKLATTGVGLLGVIKKSTPWVLWNADGTRGLVVIPASRSAATGVAFTFQGDIGAEAPSITRGGNQLSEYVNLGVVQLGQTGIRNSVNAIAAVPSGMKTDPEGVAGTDNVTQITWTDSRNLARTLTLGAYLHQYDFSVDDHKQVSRRIVNDNALGHPGFGYVVSQTPTTTALLGKVNPPTGMETAVFQGGHHAIHRVEMIYDRDRAGGTSGIKVPVVIEWLVANGRDHPVWAVTWKMSEVTNPNNINFVNDPDPDHPYYMDTRGPFGSLNFDGAASPDKGDLIGGVAWGDCGFKFSTTDDQLTMNSPWTYNTPNAVNFTQTWTKTVNAEMGIVETRTSDSTMGNPDRVVGRERGHTSKQSFPKKKNCTDCGGDTRKYVMPCDERWPYQLMNLDWDFTQDKPLDEATSTKLIGWGSPYGWLGAQSFGLFDGSGIADGRGDRSYATFVVLGLKSRFDRETGLPDPNQGDVASTIRAVEALAAATINNVTSGALNTQVPKGPGITDTKSVVNGYNDTYATYHLSASANRVAFTFIPAPGQPVRNPIFVIAGYTAQKCPMIRINGTSIAVNTATGSGAFASVNMATRELWVTVIGTISSPINVQVST